MIRSNSLMGRILIGSAIGGLLGLVLLLMGIAVVIHALNGGEGTSDRGLEIEHSQGDGTYEQSRDEAWDDDHDDDADEHDLDHDRRDDDEREDDDRAYGEDVHGLDEAYRHLGPAYPGYEAPPAVPLPPRAAEPLPPSMRSQWRSIFEDDEPAPRAAPVPAQPPAAPTARPAPKAPTAPRTPPQANRDEESLFY